MRRFMRFGFSCALMVAAVGLSRVASAQSVDCDRVEEDWELVLGTPSQMEVGPQIGTTMSPEGDNTQLYFAFNVNYRFDPFRAGGLQVQCWYKEHEVALPESQKTASCQTPGETIRWTQRLSLQPGTLSFDILNGTSTTWGNFGQGDNLRLSVTYPETNLTNYRPSVSTAYSGPTWQRNLVQSMTLKEVRYYRGGTLVATITAPQTIVP